MVTPTPGNLESLIAAGAQVVVRDEEWLVTQVQQTPVDGLLVRCIGTSTLVRTPRPRSSPSSITPTSDTVIPGAVGSGPSVTELSELMEEELDLIKDEAVLAVVRTALQRGAPEVTVGVEFDPKPLEAGWKQSSHRARPDSPTTAGMPARPRNGRSTN